MISESTIGYYKYRVSYMIDEVSVSFIDIEVVMEDINIIDVFTKEEYRRKGYSRKLFDYIFDKYKDKRFMLEVRTKNSIAISLYESLGFKVIHTRLKYYKDDDAYIMERK